LSSIFGVCHQGSKVTQKDDSSVGSSSDTGYPCHEQIQFYKIHLEGLSSSIPERYERQREINRPFDQRPGEQQTGFQEEAITDKEF
jgi:hypothetical protein